MIAYNQEILKNTFAVNHAEELQDQNFIEKKDLTSIKKNLPHLKNSGILLRIGFYLLGNFLISSILGVLSLFFVGLTVNYEIQFYLNAVISIAGAEFLARSYYFRHGLDDSFIISIPFFFAIAFDISTESIFVGLSVLSIFGIVCAIRYLHSVSALIAIIGIVGVCTDLIIEHKAINTANLPIVVLICGLFFYFLNELINRKKRNYIYYDVIKMVKIVSLLLIYFSMNYLVVRELSILLMNIEIDKSGDISFAWLFYILTFAIPIVYIIFGLRNHDRVFLWTGIFTLGIGILSILHYYPILPFESIIIISGIILFISSYVLIKKIQFKTTGITFQPDRGSSNAIMINAQAILVSAILPSHVPKEPKSKMPFGGGGFSGGGSGDSF